MVEVVAFVAVFVVACIAWWVFRDWVGERNAAAGAAILFAGLALWSYSDRAWLSALLYSGAAFCQCEAYRTIRRRERDIARDYRHEGGGES